MPAQLVRSIIKASTISSVSDAELKNMIQQVIEANPKAVGDYKKGKEQAVMFLVGMVMKALKGKGNPQDIRRKIISII